MVAKLGSPFHASLLNSSNEIDPPPGGFRFFSGHHESRAGFETESASDAVGGQIGNLAHRKPNSPAFNLLSGSKDRLVLIIKSRATGATSISPASVADLTSQSPEN